MNPPRQNVAAGAQYPVAGNRRTRGAAGLHPITVYPHCMLKHRDTVLLVQ